MLAGRQEGGGGESKGGEQNCYMLIFCESSLLAVCRYYADIIVGLLQDAALQATMHPYIEPNMSVFAIPPPMFDNNLESATKCLRGNLLQQRVYQSVVSSTAATCVDDSCQCGVM